ncbi:hypothetical protein OKA05_12020 [Luteolibacter arcticus]|uniref:DUF2796 domain-containing protein n=1 Tax=Luteolibacter arcticus TaxID=1581411 RepID=A0ABT3GIF5_9BACT|nr:hypothetical protein [Luteolibacter arcticus]MCW1923282.1 hypothetical protein [Luteolibacter arcticus]
MKPKQLILLALLGTPLAFAEEKHDHDHDKETKEEHAEHDHDHEDEDEHEHAKKGPNGGHLVESKAGFTLEVVVDKERKARVVFLDKDKKAAVALEAQTITGSAGERSAPVRLAFAKGKDADANVLISDKALPEGAHVPVILVIKTTADAKAVTERFELHLH